VRPRLLLVLSALLAGGCTPGTAGPSSAPPGQAAAAIELPTGFPRSCAPGEVQVMLLGSFHFQGSDTDAVSGTPLDLLGPRRQAELDELVERLARWAPDQVAVEWPLSMADTVHAVYQRYVAAGGETRNQNEVVQVGFRLARRLGHSTIHPVDHHMPIGNDSLGALLERRLDVQAESNRLMATLRNRVAEFERVYADSSITAKLRHVNREEALRGGNSLGMFGSFLGAGEGANRGGPQLLARWYERNFHMAHNLTRVLRPDTRRVLLLVGTGHVPPLRNILDEAPQFCPVSPLPYLQ
jgi:hypothetical protein